MYTAGQILHGLRRGISTPHYFALELNRAYHRRLYRRSYNPGGIDVVDADWDNLLILDACRYDTFAAVHDLPGRLESRESRGTHTLEFLQGNFAGLELPDTVYVTATPQLYRWRDELDVTFHDEVHIWRGDGWSDEHNTVLPETVREYALEADALYPNKRLIVHFIQPHYPFIDSDLHVGGLHPGEDVRDIWARLRSGELEIPPGRIKKAYQDNLVAALPAIRDLLAELRGRTVVTSDHGNMFGERAFPVPVREWGHPPGIYTKELVRIPWLTADGTPRKEIVAEAPTRTTRDIATVP